MPLPLLLLATPPQQRSCSRRRFCAWPLPLKLIPLLPMMTMTPAVVVVVVVETMKLKRRRREGDD
jgi:hypothetical protein